MAATSDESSEDTDVLALVPELDEKAEIRDDEVEPEGDEVTTTSLKVKLFVLWLLLQADWMTQPSLAQILGGEKELI